MLIILLQLLGWTKEKFVFKGKEKYEEAKDASLNPAQPIRGEESGFSE
jgi:hypothetical protein